MDNPGQRVASAYQEAVTDPVSPDNIKAYAARFAEFQLYRMKLDFQAGGMYTAARLVQERIDYLEGSQKP